MNMRYLSILSLLLYLLADSSFSQTGEEVVKECESEAAQYLSKEHPELSKKYFSLRASLSLHRLAWLHLQKLNGETKNPRQTKVENSILSLLTEHDEEIKKDSDFKKSAELFKEKQLSRKTLSKIINPLTKLMVDSGEVSEDSPFTLTIEDFKMMEILSELEDIQQTASFKLTQNNKGSFKSTNIINLIKIIDSSYSTLGNETADVSTQIETVENEVEKIKNNLKGLEELFFNTLKNKSSACKAIAAIESIEITCVECNLKNNTYKEDFGLKNIIEKTLYKQLKDSQYEGVRYNDVWLKTEKTHSKKKSPLQKSTQKIQSFKTEGLTAQTKKINSTPNQPIEKPVKELHSIGSPTQPIENPESIIQNFSQLNFEDLIDLSHEKKQKWASSILRKESAFLFQKKLYDTKTGKEILNRSPSMEKNEQTLKRELYLKNGKKVYSFNGTIYNVSNNTSIEALELIQSHPEIKLSDENKKDHTYLKSFAVAITNKDPSFQVGDQFFDTKTQKRIESPYPQRSK